MNNAQYRREMLRLFRRIELNTRVTADFTYAAGRELADDRTAGELETIYNKYYEEYKQIENE